MTTTGERPYLPHIDGLRAIAVLSVVGYHLGFKRLTGGFIGVDVFFVVSGFLISRIVFEEVRNGTFTFARFYERRGRRILPAFYVVSLAVLIAGASILLPMELDALARSLAASVLLAGNVFFFAHSSYFDPAADTLPLLHYWSLGVEEQFYLLFPCLVVWAARWRPSALRALILVCLVASLGASQATLAATPSAAFYLLPFRAFELLIGALLSLPDVPAPRGRILATTATVAGLACIGWAVLSFTRETPFPGLAALLPCAGTALVLLGCAHGAPPVGAWLGAPPLRWVGRISYSLYLIHWPLIVFAQRLYPYTGASVRRWSVLALSLLLGGLSYALVEQPVRLKRQVWTPRRIFASATIGACALLGASGVVVLNEGFAGRLDDKLQKLLSHGDYARVRGAYQEGTCFLNPEQKPADYAVECLPGGARTAVLWGDSHAAHLYPGLSQPLAEAGYSLGQLSASACTPIVGLTTGNRPHCKPFNDFALAKIRALKPPLVILSAQDWRIDERSLASLAKTSSELRELGTKVVLLGTGPIYRDNVPSILAERWKSGNSSRFSDRDLLDHNPFIGKRAQKLATIEATLKERLGPKGVRVVSIIDVVCPKKRCPMISSDDIPLHWDQSHLTVVGSRFFARKLTPHIVR